MFHFDVLGINFFLSKIGKKNYKSWGHFQKYIIMKGIQGKLCIGDHIKHIKLSKDI
jgi:hypothetical protein